MLCAMCWFLVLCCCARSHDDSSRRQRAGALLLLRGDLRPAGVSVPVHRERQPGDHTLLLYLTCRKQLAGILPDLCRMVSSLFLHHWDMSRDFMYFYVFISFFNIVLINNL